MSMKLSCVAYANTLPFVKGVARLPEGERPELLLDPPYRCAERLRSGEAEVSLLPSIELARTPTAVPVGGLGIAARREVRSVLLFSRKPVRDCRSVAVDANSRTSVALMRILLAKRFGSRPAIEAMPPDAEVMLARCDACLVIGDAALKARPEGARVLDLGEAWNDATGLPFVFAVWAGRDASAAARAGPLLSRALDLGLQAIPSFSGPVSRTLGLTSMELETYLTRSIHFRLGPREMKSLDLFFLMSKEEGLLSATRNEEGAQASGAGDG